MREIDVSRGDGRWGGGEGVTRSHTVLVIEDNATTRNLFRHALAAEELIVCEAATAAEAVAYVTTKPAPDLIVLDLLLPDRDGFELLEELRAVPALAAIPIIACSGFLSRLEQNRVRARGFTDFLAKPVEPSRLVQVVRGLLPARSPTDASRSSGATILVVDDEPVHRRFMKLRLVDRGHAVVTAVDGIEALQCIRAGGIDAVLSDVMMPRLDGFGLSAVLQMMLGDGRPPIVLVSSNYTEPEDAALARSVGAEALVSRTPDLAEPIAAIEMAIARHRVAPPPSPDLETLAAPALTPLLPPSYTDRVVHQLERQAEINASQAQRSALQASVLSVIAGISEALTGHHDLERVLPDVLASLLEATGISRGALFTNLDGHMVLSAAQGFSAEVIAELMSCCGKGELARLAITERRPSILGGATGYAEHCLARAGAQAGLLVPLVADDQCLGMILLASNTREIDERDWLSFARVIGTQIGQALALGRVFSRLAGSERRYRLLVEGAGEGIATLGADGVIREANNELGRMLGRPPDRLRGTRIWEHAVPDEQSASRAGFESVLSRGASRTLERRLLRSDGAIAVVDITASVLELDGEHVVFAIFRDITEEHRGRRDLRVLHDLVLAAGSAQSLGAMFEVVLRVLGEHSGCAGGAAWTLAGEARGLECVQSWTRPETDRRTWSLPAGTLGAIWCDGETRVVPGADGVSLVVPVRDAGRTVALIELFGDQPALDPHIVSMASTVGAQIGSLVERRRTEDALRVSDARFARLAESGIVGIAVTDVDGRVYEANDAYLAMFGYERAQLERGDVHWYAQIVPEDHVGTSRNLDGLMSRRAFGPVEQELRRADGTLVPVLIGVAMLDETRCIAVLSDLSERKRSQEALRAAEEQLRQAQKMEAVGQLAGGVAHDFNNILSVIISYSDMARAELPLGDPMRADLDEIYKAGERAAQLTRQLLLFSRQQIVEPTVVEPNEAIRGLAKMTRRLVGEDVEITSHLHPDVGRVRIDPGSLEQVIMNLVVNARDAMPEGGALTIETADVVLDEDFLRAHVGSSVGRHVMIAVSDTGCGMDRETMARIFEPFFTTKPVGKGTGLGLSTVFGIVRQGGGTIWVYSEPGHGTTFKVFLPCVETDALAAPALPPLAPDGGHETVLLVEDDPQVRTVARGILERTGYVVLEATNAGEALLIAEQPQSIDLVLSDVVMPHMNGPEMLSRIQALRPGIRVLCMSGYTDNAVLQRRVIDRHIAFLQKPLTPTTLARKVREVLDAPPASAA